VTTTAKKPMTPSLKLAQSELAKAWDLLAIFSFEKREKWVCEIYPCPPSQSINPQADD
jgi:hypothetical protein